MYIKKKDRELFAELDEYLKIPAKFDYYVSKLKKTHKLIKVGAKNQCHCDNCNSDFTSKKDSLNMFINKTYKCPKCKLELTVKSRRTTHWKERDMFSILDRYKDKYIIRVFQLDTEYYKGKYSQRVCEYGRHILDEYFNEEFEIYNDNVSCCITGKFVNNRYFQDKNWKINHTYYSRVGDCYFLYPYNLKRLLKDTKYKYSQIWDFAKNYKYYFNVASLFKNMNDSFELLTKLGLYGLALDDTDRYSNEPVKNYYQLIKSHLKFIKKYDLNFNELKILNNMNKEDIETIRYFAEFVQSDLLNEINLYKAKLLTDLNEHNVQEYRDYLRMCKELNYNMKDKKILYPSNIFEEHDKVLKIHRANENRIIKSAIKNRYKEIKSNTYKTKKYIIYPVEKYEQLLDESKQQSNCVKTYGERIAKNECDIYFMRLLSDKEHSLVTIEVRNNKVVQQRTEYNNDTTREQKRFISLWEKKVLGAL